MWGAGCILFIVLALLGMWVNWWFLVAGLVLHGVWDYFHNGERGQGLSYNHYRCLYPSDPSTNIIMPVVPSGK